MKKWLLLSVVMGAMPLTMTAQDDDDMYFVPTKANVEKSIPVFATASRPTPYAGSNRNVDEYNRRQMRSHYEPIAGDSVASDIIDFSAVEGVYPDSVSSADDFPLTREMSRWDGYTPDEAYEAGYVAGRKDGRSEYRSSWHSPWYYSSFYPWYDSYYYWGPWYGGYYDWYYDPWYWNTMYGGPYWGWYGPYRHWYYAWDGLYYPGGGWHHDAWYSGPNGGSRYGRGNYTGSIDRGGSTHGRFSGYRGESTASGGTGSLGSASRYNSARNRTVNGHTNYTGGGVYSGPSNSGSFSGTRSSSSGIGSSGSSTSFGSVSSGGGGGGGGSRGGSISRGGRR